MATYSTLEEIKAGLHSSLFADSMIVLRPEQRDAIDRAKGKFCKRSGRQPDYQWTVIDDGRQFLWNAKMRFGKTLCALQLAREMGMKRTLIVTHRPVVNDSWKTDFKRVMGSDIQGNADLSANYAYGTLACDEQVDKRKFYDLEKFVSQSADNHYVFFVSMQYLRLSELVNAKTQAKTQAKQDDDTWGHSAAKENEKLKADILNTDWDLVVIDEAHEGTRTALGKRVIDEYLRKKHTKMLHLSGTPFNLYEDFGKDEIFTWDYIEEQTAKQEFAAEHADEKNPYGELPQMRIMTYDISKNLQNVLDQEGVFSFSEFFRTWTGNPKADHASMPEGCRGRFVHEPEVLKFLQLLCTKDDTNNFPFSTTEYRRMFRHTLWVVTHVDEAHALEQLLKEHDTFRRFQIINVAGNSDEDETRDNALDKVKKAIGDDPEKTATITISCGRLTTGVTVRPWTAVLYLKGGENAATYMQTIFRVQSPYTTKDGWMKTACYVFDFAPDRTLKVIAHTAKFSSMTKANEKKQKAEDYDLTQEQRDKQTIAAFMQLCPLISMEGGQMTELDVNSVYKQLENVFIDRLVRKGFDDPCLYNQEELNKIDQDIINNIGEHGGQAPDERRKEAGESIDLSHMTPEQRKAYEDMVAKKKADAKRRAEEKLKKDEEFRKWWENASEEERQEWEQKEAERLAHLEELRKQREEFKKRITNIRGIALRIPLLMYGGADAGDPKDELTVDNFTRKIKDESWAEFMPKGITKEDFNKIKRCFNATRFEEAGKRYRALTREADFMHVDERIQQITEIFSYFRNPDKETVLTPWRVVNMHMSDTIGGYCFFDETFDEQTGQLLHPRYVEQGDVSRQLFDTVDFGGELPVKILEINSKTGLYPLYVTYSLFRRRLKEYAAAQCIDLKTISVQEEQVVWDDIVANNMYVICNTPMAVGITHRTLFGFRPVAQKANIKNVQLIERASKEQEGLIHDLKSVGFWKGNTSKQEMKFNAVVGNPPYQVKQSNDNDSVNSSMAGAIYPKFMDLAIGVNPNYISLITPSRWMTKTGRGISDAWVDEKLNCNHFICIHDFIIALDCFDNVEIKGGVNYFLYSQNYSDTCNYTLHQGKLSVSHCDFLNSYGLGIVVRDMSAMNILNKIIQKEGDYYNGNNFSTLVGPNTLFCDCAKGILNTSWDGYVLEKDNEHTIKYYLNKNKVKCGYAWIKESDMIKSFDVVDLHKVYIPEAGGSGTDPNVLGVPFYGEPQSICSQTYICIGYDSTKHRFSKEQCENIISYIRTKMFRYLVSIKKKTQHAFAQVYQFVPMQDFSKPWTDEELYDKYGLDMFEREHIESSINSME